MKFLSALPILASATFPPILAANNDEFIVTGDGHFYPQHTKTQNQVVSSGLNCSKSSNGYGSAPCNSSQCLLSSGGIFNALGETALYYSGGTPINPDGHKNYTLGAHSAEIIYTMIARHSNIPFYLNASSNNSIVPVCVDEHLSGFLIFQPTLLCLNGSYSGMQLEVCAPMYNEKHLVNGSTEFYTTTESPLPYAVNPALDAVPFTSTTGNKTPVTAAETPSYTAVSAAGYRYASLGSTAFLAVFVGVVTFIV